MLFVDRSDRQVLYFSIRMDLLFQSRGHFVKRIQISPWSESSTTESVLLSNGTNVTDDWSMSTPEPTLHIPSHIRIAPFSVVAVISIHVEADH